MRALQIFKMVSIEYLFAFQLSLFLWGSRKTFPEFGIVVTVVVVNKPRFFIEVFA